MAATNKSTRAGGYAPGSGLPPDPWKRGDIYTRYNREADIWLGRSLEFVGHEHKAARETDQAILRYALLYSEKQDTTPQGELFAYMPISTVMKFTGKGRNAVVAGLERLSTKDPVSGWWPLRKLASPPNGSHMPQAYALYDLRARRTGALAPDDWDGFHGNPECL